MILAFKPDWGTVPAWFGGLSLVLALLIFMRDRSAAERKDVDLVGAWWEAEWERKAPNNETGRAETGTVKLHFGNSGNLPVEIAQTAFEVRTKWALRDLDQWEQEPDGSLKKGYGVWTIQPGISSHKHFISNVRVPPQEKIDSETPIDVSDLAPDHADQLELFDGITCSILWMLIIGNAGRRWEVRPGVGRRARRIRWYHRRRENQPPDFWTNASRLRQLMWEFRVWWAGRRSQ
ncbi:hypothetical protein ACIP2Y_01740 [Streptomyces sviceus]|uniref:hypothetical protein n=1 Tax=Streptomyces sviceus TaxID=285530 RepID=UPI003829E055